jgi:ElaB/YqjD/DUF883 family membrane-anchored ribosome-binding protein
MNNVTREKLASDFKAVIGDVEELLKLTVSETSESVAELRQRLERKLEEGRKALSDEERALVETAKEAKAATEAYVRENPLTALGIAAGIGVILGLLVRRD